MIDAPAIVIQHDMGGQLGDYIDRRARYRKGGLRVEIRGECNSSCTILTGLPNVCIGPRAVLGFHLPTQQYPDRAPTPTGPEFYGHVMMTMYSDKVTKWIMDNGGLSETVIYLHGEELNRMFPRCK